MRKQEIKDILTKHVNPLVWVDEMADEIIALSVSPVVDGELELRPGLLDTFAREIGQHAENCNWDSCSASEQEAAYRSAKYLLAKATPIIKAEVARETRREMLRDLTASFYAGYLSPSEVEEKVKAARNSAFYEIHTDLMSITCKDSYESMSRRVQQLLDKVHNEMALSQGGKE